jgi:hypothetical protein
VKRLNFTIDDNTADLLNEISNRFYYGNKSLTVRAALEKLAAHFGDAGWVISGYTPKVLHHEEHCHSCGAAHPEGDVLYQPIFQKATAPGAMHDIPAEPWLDCSQCVEHQPPAA